MREFKISEGQIKKLALHYLDANEYLRQWFPAAFEPEWEEIPLSKFRILTTQGLMQEGEGYLQEIGPAYNAEIRFKILSPDYRVEDGKIWRRKV